MGSYTFKYKMYKPFSTEIVNVDLHLNYNWKIIDTEARRAMEYQYTNVPSVTEAYPERRYGDKWYKSYSNAVLFNDVGPGVGTVVQEYAGQVMPWQDASPLLRGGWQVHAYNPLCYRILTRPGNPVGICEWAGAIDRGGVVIPGNTQFDDVMILTPETRPLMWHYFTVGAGQVNGTPGYSFARLAFADNNSLSVIRFGGTPFEAGENRIDFGGVRYDVDVVGP